MIEVDWNGEGLPPDGTACEFKAVDGKWKAGVYMGKHQDHMIVCCDESGACGRLGSEEFRPIRTPEQIAADARNHAIRNACTAINRRIEKLNININCSFAIAATVEAMIDAGYRKTPDELAERAGQ